VRAPGLAAWLRRVATPRARGTIAVALVTDRESRQLNRRFRGVNTPTDVLSFPSHEPRAPRPEFRAPRPESRAQSRELGEIAIARGVARRQARDAGHAESTEWRVLALHGLLHLLGYDHERDDGLMHRVERKLRRKGGLRESLMERAGRPTRRRLTR
jgi:probable rRNA maturation factor